SDTCKAFFGRKPDDSFSYQDLLASVHPEDRARRVEVLNRAIKTGTDYSIEYRNIWPDGSQHWVDVRARAVRRPDGSLKSLVGVSSDITARKVSEIEREMLLAQWAAERTALAELTATVAERGASLTQRLLAFARQQDLRASPVDLRALIQGMIDLLERSLRPRVGLRLDLPEGLPPARVDANQLELAILNLAINARDAMPDGGSIDIKVAEYQATNDPELQPGRYLRLSVIDTGQGMTPEIL